MAVIKELKNRKLEDGTRKFEDGTSKLEDDARKLEDGIEKTLTYMDFILEHWTRIRTNNAIERQKLKICRRMLVVGCFPKNGSSARMRSCVPRRHAAGIRQEHAIHK